MKIVKILLISLLLFSVTLAPVYADRTITDSRGKEVTLPDHISRVVTISDSFLEEVMLSARCD